jgi:hypothetical protein
VGAADVGRLDKRRMHLRNMIIVLVLLAIVGGIE